MRPTIPMGRRLGRVATGSRPRTAESLSSSTHRVTSTGRVVRRRSSLRRRRASRPAAPLGLLQPRSLIAAVPIALLLLLGAYYIKHEVGLVTGGVATDFQSGQAALEAGKSELKAASASHDLKGIQKSRTEFAAAVTDFQAGAQIINSSEVVRLGQVTPLVGGSMITPRVQAVDHLSSMGVSLGQAAMGAAALDMRLSSPDPHGLKGAPHLLAALKASGPDLKAVQAKLLAAQNEAHMVNLALLPSSEQAAFHKSLGSIDKAAGGIVEFNRLIPAIFDILGASGPRTYLIEQVNPSELRSGGGFIGTISVARADQGKLTILKSGDVYTLEGPRPKAGYQGYVPPPAEIGAASPAYYGLHASWALADSNVFPDQASNMRWGEWFAQHTMGLKPDGIIVMDYYAVAHLLKITGPIHLPQYGVTFTADNFVSSMVALDQTSAHKAILASAAQPLLQGISQLPTAQWPNLVSALNTAVTRGHLQFFFNSPVAEKPMVQLGWFKPINPQHATDFMMETEDNFAGSKVNHFLARHYTVDLTRTSTGIHHKVMIDLDVNEPYQGIVTTRNYLAYLRFYVSQQATNLHISSSPGINDPLVQLNPSKGSVPGGLRAVGGHFNIDMSGLTHNHFQVVVQYDTPWTSSAQSQAIYWQKQPGILNDGITVNWNENGHLYKATGALTQDVEIALSQSAVSLKPANAATVQLPSINLG